MYSMQNPEIAAILERISELLEVKGEIRFKIQAYQKAARALENLDRPAAELHAEGGLKALTGIPGIGEGIAKKIEELLATGRLKYYEELKAELPKGVEELLEVPHLGPKTAVMLAEKLRVTGVASLEKALRGHRVAPLPRMGEKMEEKLLRGVEIWKRGQERMPLGEALPLAKEISGSLAGIPSAPGVEYAGSLRRMKETVGDLDFLAFPRKPADAPAVMDAFVSLPQVTQVTARGETKAQVRLAAGRRTVDADLRVVEPASRGAALHYFTGSKAHNILVRELGVKRGLKISEYGVFRGAKRVGGATEEEIFRSVGLPFIPPEIREGAGEVEAAAAGKLPRLVEEGDLHGDLHIHSDWSDGSQPLAELAEAARKLGYEYLAVTDHSQAVRIANGLTPARLRVRNKEIDRLNSKLRGIRLLKGAEVDILKDGSLDYPDEVLAGLDVIIASVHSGFNLPEAEQTRRVVRALGNRYVTILGHPTGRLIGEREAYPIDIGEVIRAAADNGKCLELNAQVQRLDLADIHLHRAKEAGAMVAIDSDAHHVSFLPVARKLGVAMARRGWLEEGDVLNALPLSALLKKLGRGR